MITILLPQSLPEENRQADYDFDVSDDQFVAVPREPKKPVNPDDSKRFEWDMGICRTEFAIASTSTSPFSFAKERLSHWGVYFSKVDQDPSKVHAPLRSPVLAKVSHRGETRSC